MRPGVAKRRCLGILLGLLAAGGLPAQPPAHAEQHPPGVESAVEPEAARELIEQAETARQEAAARGAEWLDTRRLIEEARQEADQGNWQRAATLAEQALQQGTLASAQAERESEAWRERVVR